MALLSVEETRALSAGFPLTNRYLIGPTLERFNRRVGGAFDTLFSLLPSPNDGRFYRSFRRAGSR